MATSVKDLDLSVKRLQEILQVSKDYALTHGKMLNLISHFHKLIYLFMIRMNISN